MSNFDVMSAISMVTALDAQRTDRTQADAASKVLSGWADSKLLELGVDPSKLPSTKSEAAAKYAASLASSMETLSTQATDFRSQYLQAIKDGDTKKQDACQTALAFLGNEMEKLSKQIRIATR